MTDGAATTRAAPLEAWGDESGSHPQRDPGTYVLATVLAEQTDADSIRAAMAGVRLPNEKKVHWYGDRNRRDALIRAVEPLPFTATVVVRTGASDERDERRRRKCLERLLLEVEGWGCARLTLESRGPRPDQRDRAMLDALRASRVIASPGVRLEHRRGPEDPALWVADVVCGAVVAARTGSASHLDVLRDRVDLIEVPA